MRPKHILLALLLLLAATARGFSSPLWLRNVHTTEEASLQIRTRKLTSSTWRRANTLLRSRITHRSRTTHPRLLRTLLHIQRHFGNRRIDVVSAYRAPGRSDALTSYHQVGRAADIRIRGVTNKALFTYCRTLPRTGCGYYPKADFVHIDVRKRSSLWVDRSAPGDPRDYAPNPRQWLRARYL